MNRVLIDLTREQFWDAMFQGGIDSWYDMGNTLGCLGRTRPGAIWVNPESRQFPFPYDRGAVWRVLNSDHGHWQKRRASGGRDRRDVALAWWTAEDGRKFVRAVGTYRMSYDGRWRRHFDGIPENAGPHQWVWPTPGEFLAQFIELNALVLDGLDACGEDGKGLRAAVLGPSYDDPAAWLIAADWLEEHGHDPSPVRRLFQPGFAAEDDARIAEELRLAAEAHQLTIDRRCLIGGCACGQWAAIFGHPTHIFDGPRAVEVRESARLLPTVNDDGPSLEFRRRHLEVDHYRTHLAPLGVPDGKIRPTRIFS